MHPIALMVIYMIIGHALIFTGLGLLSSKMIEDYLAAPYARWGLLVLYACIIAVPANLLIAEGYKTAKAAWAGPTQMVVAVLATVILAMILDGTKITWNLGLSVLCMSATAVWVSLSLQHAS